MNLVHKNLMRSTRSKILIRHLHSKLNIKGQELTLQIAGAENSERIWNFLDVHFIPDEPITRSFGLHENKTWADKRFRKSVYEGWIIKVLEKNSSIMATTSDGTIVGTMLGGSHQIEDEERNKKENPWSLDQILTRFSWLAPKKVKKVAMLTHLQMDLLRYKPQLIFEDLGCGKIFLGDFLCVERNLRMTKLGQEMASKSVDIARSQKCDFYVSWPSGNGSQKIRENLGFSTLRTVKYDEFKDSHGNQVVDQPGDNVESRVMYLKLN